MFQFIEENLTGRYGWHCESDLVFEWNGEKDVEVVKDYFMTHKKDVLKHSSLDDPNTFREWIQVYESEEGYEVVVEIHGTWSL